MPPRRISGPYSPLQELERRLTEASFHPEELASILNMANNGGDHQPNADGTKFSRPQDVVDSQPSTPQDSEALRLRTGPARWSARWHRASKAAAQPSSRAEIGRSRAPTLPDLPRFPSLPDFEAGTCGDQRLSRIFSLNAHRRDEKSLPRLPVTDGEDNAITGVPHNRGNADQRSSSDNERNNRQKNEGKDVQTNARGRIDLSTHKNANTNPIRPSRLVKRNVPRRAVTENPVNDTDRLNPSIVDGRGTYPPPPDSRSLSVPTVPRKTVRGPSGHAPSPQHRAPRKPLPTARCRSPGCPIKHLHSQGLYLHDDHLSQWKHPYWGISNPPPLIWQAWDRRTDKVATPQEVGDIIGFMENHSYGPRGKVKERASPDDYEVVRKERGGTWAGGFF